MAAHEQVDAIRIISVTKNGRDAAFSSVCKVLSNISPDGFVAIDAEFSGMGSHKNFKHDNLQTRYSALRDVANTRAIFSVGLSIFNPIDAETTRDAFDSLVLPAASPSPPQPSHRYSVATYDFLLSCQSEFSMTPGAGEFLVSHSFDFHRMFRLGIPYKRASTDAEGASADGRADAPRPKQKDPFSWDQFPRGLLWRIGRHGVPIVVHNGLLDLAFLYAALQAPLPELLSDFVVALGECVPAGFWDSKVLSEMCVERASFLGYLFASSVLHGAVSIENSTCLPTSDTADPPTEDIKRAPDTLCALYAFRGFCNRETACPFAHDPFRVVELDRQGKAAKDIREASARSKKQIKEFRRKLADYEWRPQPASKKAKKRQMRQVENAAQGAVNQNGTSDVRSQPTDGNRPNSDESASDAPNGDSGAPDEATDSRPEALHTAHTAGWDAFCTGYVFASFKARLEAKKLNEQHNYIALPGKLSNLLLRKSEYAHLDAEMNDAC